LSIGKKDLQQILGNELERVLYNNTNIEAMQSNNEMKMLTELQQVKALKNCEIQLFGNSDQIK